MPDNVNQGQFKRFLNKHHFTSKGRKNHIYIGLLKGKPRVVTFHYHKDKDLISKGLLSAISKQLGIPKNELIDMIKDR